MLLFPLKHNGGVAYIYFPYSPLTFNHIWASSLNIIGASSSNRQRKFYSNSGGKMTERRSLFCQRTTSAINNKIKSDSGLTQRTVDYSIIERNICMKISIQKHQHRKARDRKAFLDLKLLLSREKKNLEATGNAGILF